MTIKEFINPARIFMKTKEGKGTTLDKYLKVKFDNLKLVSLLDSSFHANSNQYTYATLTDDYTNYDLLFVRVASGAGGDEGITDILFPKINTSTRPYLYAMDAYWAHTLVRLQNNNQIGIRVETIRGWEVAGIYITSVYGIKF